MQKSELSYRRLLYRGDSLLAGQIADTTTLNRKVAIEVEINAEDWDVFTKIPRMTALQKGEFLSMLVQNGLEEILYNNPKLLMSYVRESS